ncbi:hypothetical protein BY996DRAFT_449130 [Phakopsora pachyrhizi]|uniref:Uncharacterized protein n=1 Tax=Phakopsora pachyrhizi TaxID=170000 RepID=A0AAV0AJL2_PHAPC|nr:hypothetical protein BY996DRAFT_449130 [Phakopsora pachyrhizi]CAH7667625.1 hypothetical protein PPACK8108_LOCUS2044 [Phakopsora pachyrhizi]
MSISGRSSITGNTIRHKSSSILLSNNNNSSSSNNSNSLIAEDDPCPWQSEPITINSSNSNNNSNSNSSTSVTPPSQSINLANSVESLINLAQKRITTFVYLKKVHEGKVHWFNTILLTRSDLEKWLDHSRMVRRTTRFSVLGMSLSSMLDIMTLQDFLRGLISLLNEYESIPEDHFKPKMVNLSKGIFKQSSKTQRKSTGTTSDYSISLQDSNDQSLLYSPNIPFELDYFEVWITLCDLLVEVYQKIINFISDQSDLIGTSNNNNQNSANSPRPSFNSMMSNQNGFNNNSSSNISGNNGSIGNGAINLSQNSIDMINKVDSKLKKLIVLLTKEIDGIARSCIREELTQLDPMLSSSIYNTPNLSNNSNGQNPYTSGNHNSLSTILGDYNYNLHGNGSHYSINSEETA